MTTPSFSRTSSAKVLGAAGLVVAGLLGLGSLVKSPNPLSALGLWPKTEVVQPGNPDARYYRMKASFLYKGQPMEFDIVVSCGARVTSNIDRDKSYEVGVAPFVYGLPTFDGKAVVVRLMDDCSGESNFDNIPPAEFPLKGARYPMDMIPMVAVFDSAAEPRFGWLYATEDAYRSPLSELAFKGMTKRRATIEEWREWRRTEAARNIVKGDRLDHGPEQVPDAPGRWRFGASCRGYTRMPIPEELRPMVRELWPEDRPTYWAPPRLTPSEVAEKGVKVSDAVFRAIDAEQSKAQARRANTPMQQIALRSQGYPGYPWRDPWIFAAPEVYPTTFHHSLNNYDELTARGELIVEMKQFYTTVNGTWQALVATFPAGHPWPPASSTEITPELRGFMKCDVLQVNQGFSIQPVDVRHSKEVHLINGGIVRGWHGTGQWTTQYGFEQDTHLIGSANIELRDVFGGL
jgi:hypothetical protein